MSERLTAQTFQRAYIVAYNDTVLQRSRSTCLPKIKNTYRFARIRDNIRTYFLCGQTRDVRKTRSR